ncbi:restriction endonuclease subunit S [Alcanivorax sp. 1008]|uniref:restriction endonuclease subunit S n=1 Tax=Alcanivorax sp. 1008 TaxID=2816853 RepID=UPI001E15C0EF|nr:restriction endonuclease subunit S [Alcanivorax sp. 1008]MCC1498086.1 restriction endonuclease subunit S [Alcanivorax sp. 1008]
MSFPRYQKYKDSGVQWLGDVPQHWTVGSIKYLGRLNPSKSEVTEDGASLCSFIPMEKLKTGEIALDENRPIEDVIGGYTYFRDGDVLFAKVTPCFENRNMAIAQGLTGGLGFGSSEINVLRPRNADVRFLYYRIQEHSLMKIWESEMSGAGGLKRVPTEIITNFLVAAPDKEEQESISAFLDHETAKIDALIAEQQRLIELLKEKRQAVISHAVTKGINPNAPMKDSGVEWLGEVPAHWEITRIGWQCIVGNGCTPARDNPSYWNDGHYPWLNSSKVNLKRVIDADQFVTDKALRECALPIVKPGSVLMAITGEGKTRGMVTIAEIEATINQHVAFIQPRSKKLYPVYLHDWLNANYSRIRHDSADWGSTKAAITCSDVRAYPLPLPPIEEQEAICHFIQSKSSLINDLISSSESSISLLQERRSALVSVAVTGIIDVRDWRSDTALSASMPMASEEAAQYS